MPSTFSYQFDTPRIQGQHFLQHWPLHQRKLRRWLQQYHHRSILQRAIITKVSGHPQRISGKDVDIAVDATQKAFETTWGLNAPGRKRAELLNKLALLMEANSEELAALEALDNGKTFGWAKVSDLDGSIACIKYYAGWADKISGQALETDEGRLAYTRHEPIGVVGQIIPWNFPLLMFTWKIGPALATGNTIVIKPSEFTPLTALRMAPLIVEAGFPPGVVNILVGYGDTVGAAITRHMNIDKVAFTGSVLVGRKIMEASAKSNLKNVTEHDTVASNKLKGFVSKNYIPMTWPPV